MANALENISPNYSNKYLIYNGTSAYDGYFTAPSNGYIIGSGYGTQQSNSFIYFFIGEISLQQQGNADESLANIIPVRKGDVVRIWSHLALVNKGIYFVPCN